MIGHELEFLERRRAEEERAAASASDPRSIGIHRQLASDYAAAANAFRDYSTRASGAR